jgi:hypothetical protein
MKVMQEYIMTIYQNQFGLNVAHELERIEKATHGKHGLSNIGYMIKVPLHS